MLLTAGFIFALPGVPEGFTDVLFRPPDIFAFVLAL